MEKKKLLLVAISVGVFLVIVIGASLLVIPPGSAVAPVAAAARRPIAPGSPGVGPALPVQDQGEPADSAGLAQTPGDSPAVQSLPVPVAAAGPGADDTLRQFGVPQNGESGGNRVVITVPRPSTAAVNESAPPPPKQVRNVAAPSKQTRSAAAPAATPTAPAAKSTPRPAVVAAAQPARKPAAAAPQPRTYDAFWVQTGSFSVRNRADTVRETLASKGIASIIENRDVNG
ncbi:MAG: hypothetical protein LBU21_10300, partial [Treponema sp.]|nr:hypothetical protein [Treponema sp.]